jgi:hypothetical protein
MDGQGERRAGGGVWPREEEGSDEWAQLVSEIKLRKVSIRLGVTGGPWAVSLAGTNGRPAAFFFFCSVSFSFFCFQNCFFQTFAK